MTKKSMNFINKIGPKMSLVFHGNEIDPIPVRQSKGLGGIQDVMNPYKNEHKEQTAKKGKKLALAISLVKDQ